MIRERVCVSTGGGGGGGCGVDEILCYNFVFFVN